MHLSRAYTTKKTQPKTIKKKATKQTKTIQEDGADMRMTICRFFC